MRYGCHAVRIPIPHERARGHEHQNEARRQLDNLSVELLLNLNLISTATPATIATGLRQSIHSLTGSLGSRS